MRKLSGICLLLLCLGGCSENYAHDEKLATTDAMEFAQVAFVRHDLDKGYALLADKARAYVPLDKFKETVTAMHPMGYPLRLGSAGAEAVKGEKVVLVALRGEGRDGMRFSYSLSLMGTAESGYRVRTFSGGGPVGSGSVS